MPTESLSADAGTTPDELEQQRSFAAGAAAIQYPATDAGNAEWFVGQHRDLVRYDHARRRWVVWDSHRWRPDDDAAIYRLVLSSTRDRRDQALAMLDVLGPKESDEDEAITAARGRAKKLLTWCLSTESRTRLEAALVLASRMLPIADAGDGWDTRPGLIGVPNGVVDLRTGELRAGRPDDRITMTTGVEYVHGAICPRWEQHLLEVLEDADVVPFVQRLLGYSLTAEAVLHLLIFLMGTGRNGKGVTIRTADYVLGDYAQVVSAHAFAEERRNAHSTEVADLELARFAYCEELGGGKLNAERMKDLSGGGKVTARRMRSDSMTFPQTWQLWFTTNGLPRSDDNSWGWWERVIAIDFPRQFVGPDADPQLDEKLRAEAEGILAWIVQGAVAWYADGLGAYPEAIAAKTSEYREDLDPLDPLFRSGYFLKCEDAIWTPTEKLFAAYKEYADTALILDERRWTERTLGTRLNDQHRKARHKVPFASGGAQEFRGYHGIRAGWRASEELYGWSWRFAEDGSSGWAGPLSPEGIA